MYVALLVMAFLVGGAFMSAVDRVRLWSRWHDLRCAERSLSRRKREFENRRVAWERNDAPLPLALQS